MATKTAPNTDDSSPAPCSLIVTDGDRALCEDCYEAGFCEQDPATHFYAEIPHGMCDSCGIEVPPPKE